MNKRKDTVIALAEKDCQALLGPRPDFREFLLTAPSFEDLDLTRDRSPMREANL